MESLFYSVGDPPPYQHQKGADKMIISKNLDELKNFKLWLNYIRLWNPTKKDGRGGYDKPPINPHTLRDGRTNNKSDWTTYDTAAANIGKEATHRDAKHRDESGKAPTVKADIEGLGLVLAAGYCGVDLDNVIDKSGQLAPFAADIVRRLDTYSEISPSGKGLHLLLYCGDLLQAALTAEKESGKEGAGNFGKQFVLDSSGEITNEAKKVYELEIYFYVNGGRYFTVTGNTYEDKPINRTKGKELKAIFREYTEKLNSYNAARRAKKSPSVGTPSSSRVNTDSEGNQKMIESALKAINPSELSDYGEWNSIMTALKVLGYTEPDAEEWSSGELCGIPNPKNVPETNLYKWDKFNFPNGDENAAGIIINAAKRFGWSPSEAFTEEERRDYGRSLYTEDERREYAKKKSLDEDFGDSSPASDLDEGRSDPDEDSADLKGKEPEKKSSPSVGTVEDRETATAAEWEIMDYYAAIITAEKGNKSREVTAIGFDDYQKAREEIEKEGYTVTAEVFQTIAEYLRGFVTFKSAFDVFLNADDSYITLESFPLFSKAAKIRAHDSVIIAAETGKGKSSLALNFLNDLNKDYPAIYFNLEMDELTVFRRLVAIQSQENLAFIEKCKENEAARGAVEKALKTITARKPLQVINEERYLEEMEAIIEQSTKGRTEPTAVFIDHSLLVKMKKESKNRYERFTDTSEELRAISRKYNIILFLIMQQNRAGQTENEEPVNSSLKESGSWENDATQIVFLWYDPKIKRKKLIMTKNRSGNLGSFVLDYWKDTQRYYEAEDQDPPKAVKTQEPAPEEKKTTRDKIREKLQAAIKELTPKGGELKIEILTLADKMGKGSDTIKKYAKEYGLYTIEGDYIKPIETPLSVGTPEEGTEEDPDSVIF